MSDATASDYAWFTETYRGSLCVSGFCLTLVRDLSPAEVLARIGGTGAGDPPLHAYAAAGGAALLEPAGHAGTLAETTRLLSRGTATATVALDAAGALSFLYAVDGRLVTGLADGGTTRFGAAPDRLRHQLREICRAGDPPAPVPAALALAERAAGVRLAPGHLCGPALTGSAGHLY
ncbi:hypothetical protein Sru01_35660 [Sphaerisporangium rufum]|uniref:Uncharacterized protein n=1 Tax=Sphaerisporangium rufum TaxID=1381558 RepID=A0A919V0B1_9ACTN|nr:DUF6461 domain-containing protein [Sphaerisporangium rufum]GII78584.1 hypothetical protein Sru01_35660 [Sphaerisporangium rufum]